MTMAGAIVGGVAGLIGIALGGGIRAWEARGARRREAASVLSAICAEVEAINRLAHHRQFLAGFQAYRAMNAARVAAGEGGGPADWMVLELTQNYFAVFDALAPKLGMIDPYFADRIVRFYTYAKAVTENYRPDAPFQADLTAELAIHALDNDIMLLGTMHILGEHIAGFRKVHAPRGIIDPFPAVVAAEEDARKGVGAGQGEPSAPNTNDLPVTAGG